MSLSSGKSALKTSLQAMVDNNDPDKDSAAAIDEFLDALETWVKEATVTVPALGLLSGSPGAPVTGSSTTGGLS